MSDLHATDRVSTIFARLQSADLSLLAKKLQKKEQPDLPFSPDGAPSDAESLVAHTMDIHYQDAEPAFAHTLPVGLPTPAGVNPGILYKALRAKENPSHRVKEVNLLFGQANMERAESSRNSDRAITHQFTIGVATLKPSG